MATPRIDRPRPTDTPVGRSRVTEKCPTDRMDRLNYDTRSRSAQNSIPKISARQTIIPRLCVVVRFRLPSDCLEQSAVTAIGLAIYL